MNNTKYELFLDELENMEFLKLNAISSMQTVMNNCSDICIDQKLFTDLSIETYEMFIKGYAYLLSLEYCEEDIGRFFFELFDNDLSEYQIGQMCYYVDINTYNSKAYDAFYNSVHKAEKVA